MVEKLASMFTVSNVTSDSPFFESKERFRFEPARDLAQCFEALPNDLNGGIDKSSCRRTKLGQLSCRYDCDSSLLDHVRFFKLKGSSGEKFLHDGAE